MRLLLLGASLSPLFAAQAQVERADVDLNYVTKLAEDRARSPFHSPRANLPEVLLQKNLDYDKYRKIQFRHDRDFWAGANLPFRVEFFPPGYIYQEPVKIYEFAKSFLQRIRFVRDWFDYGGLNIQDQIPADTGYAGFKILYQLNKPGAYDELASFLGASYFRMLGAGQRYGPSARGLALNCGGTGAEEFPIFTDFWLGKPGPNANELHLFALLDSVSCTGAYEFNIKPGETTTCDINAVLFFREKRNISVNQLSGPIRSIGWAPLTSMFWFGPSCERKYDDYRPAVHDSEGLLISTADGQTLWRPLNNASQLRHSVFPANNVRGFGLLQRDRNFADYQDMFNPYHLVPSIWVKPSADWGSGDIHLVELSTNYEGLDNIVAFWSPSATPAPMQPVRFGYQLSWTREENFKTKPDRAVSTRIGLDGGDPNKRVIQIEFSGPDIDGIPESNPPKAEVNCTANASIYETQVLKDPYDGLWRVVLKFQPKAGNTEPVELRCTLRNGEENASETWIYLWSPP